MSPIAVGSKIFAVKADMPAHDIVGTKPYVRGGEVVEFVPDSALGYVEQVRTQWLPGEIVAMASDGTSTSPERAHPVNFLGRRLRMASGLEFLARATDSPIAFFTCRELSGQRFQIVISKPLRLEEGGLQAAYDALQQALLQAPGAWWGADQYREYQDAP